MQGLAGSHQFARFDSFEVSLRSGELSRDGQKIKLTEQCFQILTMLLERSGEVVFRNEIQKKLWPNDTVVEFENSINAAIKKLRSALGDSADEPRYIETLARRGYRFMRHVEWVEGGAPQPPTRPVQQLPSSTYLVGKKVSHYRVLDILGGGGMGVVYKAEDLRLGRRVALKFLPEEMASEPAALERFQREAKAASALNHPNICTIYEIEDHEGQPFIVMELLEGQTLRDLLSKAEPGVECLPLGKVLDLSTQIVKALDAAHEKGIVHRDIKPANIFLTSGGQAKILDFGLAKIAVAGDGELSFTVSADRESTVNTAAPPEGSTSALLLSRTGSTMGTAGYMSPEQVRGEKLDAQTDLFSFGLVLYEMVTGRRAFTGNTPSELHEAILSQSPTPPRDLNAGIPVRLEEIITNALEKDREKRYQYAIEILNDLTELKEATQAVSRPPSVSQALRSRWPWLAPALALSLMMAWTASFYLRHVHASGKLTDKDNLILADFTNSTGDIIFDKILGVGLGRSLRQSPFLNVLYSSQVAAGLRMMGQPASTPLTDVIAPEVCRRVGSKAFISGAISLRSNRYVITLKTVNCQSGEVLAQSQTVADRKDGVLDALSEATAKLRADLGESSASVWEYNVPLTQAITPSLEAFEEFNRALDAGDEKGEAGSLPHYLRAIELDPNFASAYLGAGEDYLNGLGSSEKVAEYVGKAFELQQHATLPVRLQIEATYYIGVTGQLDKVAETLEKTIAIYPRSVEAQYVNLGIVYEEEGKYGKAAEMTRQAIPFDPDGGYYGNLAHSLIALQRFQEAQETLKTALARAQDTDVNHDNLYSLAFLANDRKEMDTQATWFKSHPEWEDLGLARESDTEAYYGHFRRARELTRDAVLAAGRFDKEKPAYWWNAAALREASVGNSVLARRNANQALKLAPRRQDVEMEAALALAMAGDTTDVETLVQDLNHRSPLDTQVQSLFVPTIEAQVALGRRDARAALEGLKETVPIELGFVPSSSGISCLWANYIRGEAFLAEGNGAAARIEFQKIVDHSGIVQNCPTGALAHLGLARAYATQSRTNNEATTDSFRANATASYKQFFALWKDADPDTPVLKQAKLEFERLK